MEKQSSPLATNCVLGITKNLYLNEETADVYFIFNVDCKYQRVPAHKIILATGSPVFRTMFYGDLKEESDVQIVDTSPEHFKEFLAIFYLPQITITNENCQQFLYLAEKYNVSEGVSICNQFLLNNTDISTNIDELWSVFALAIKFNLQKLINRCVLEIRKSAARIFNSDKFINCPRNILKTILLLEDLNCTDVDVYNGCKAWAESACTRNGKDAANQQNIRSELDECFYLIPFATMKIGTFSKVVFDNRTLFTPEEVIDIMALITTGTPTENTRTFIKNNCTCVSFAWYEDHYLDFKPRRTFYDGYQIYRVEEAAFSSSEKLLFGGLSLVSCKRRTSSRETDTNITLSATVTVTKDIDDSSEELHETIRVLTDADGCWPTVIVFNKPIVIHPNTMYTILVDFTENDLSEEGLVEEWECDGASRESITHKGVSLQFNHGEDMFISQFYFNRL